MLNEFLVDLNFYKSEVELWIKTKMVKHNDRLFRELDVVYKKKNEISVYDKIESYYLSMIQFLDFVKAEVELYLAKLNSLSRTSNINDMSINYSATQMKVICYYLIGERLGIYHDPRETKIFAKLVSGAKFLKNGKFQPAGDINSMLSRTRTGRDTPSIKNRNSKFKKEMREVLNQIIMDIDDSKLDINVFD